MRATYEFVVDGQTFSELETKATEKAAQFFGDRPFKLTEIDLFRPVRGTYVLAHVAATVDLDEP